MSNLPPYDWGDGESYFQMQSRLEQEKSSIGRKSVGELEADVIRLEKRLHELNLTIAKIKLEPENTQSNLSDLFELMQHQGWRV